MKVTTIILICFGFVAGDDKAKLIADALSAAPPTLKGKVTVVDWNKNVLRKGSSQCTCFPTPPTLAGKAPMCMDGPLMEWRCVEPVISILLLPAPLKTMSGLLKAHI